MSGDRVVVVGGGVLGTLHAWEACRRGLDVVHLEQDDEARRASVRNFGLVWVSGRSPGAELDLALRARTVWERLADEVPGIGFRPDGSITLAATDGDVALMRQLAAAPDAARREVEVLSPAQVREANPALRGRYRAGLLCRRDAVVEPARVLPAVRRRLAETGRYRWVPGRRAVAVGAGAGAGVGAAVGAGIGVGVGAVEDHTGERYDGSLVICCTGADHAGLGGAVGAALRRAPLRRCRLLMMQTAPCAERLTTALADADSMRYYPAFDLPARADLPPPSESTAALAMQLLLVQRASGELTIGDPPAYDEPIDCALDEAA